MNNKAYFQFVSVLGLVGLFVFLVWDSGKTFEMAVSGAVFLIGGALALLAGRSDAGD